MPPMPDGVEEGIIRGLYRFIASDTKVKKGRKAHLLGSGAIMTEVLEARELLEEAGVSTDVWSVTSYNELARDALSVERANRLQSSDAVEVSYVEDVLQAESGVFVAASDFMKALPLSIAKWVPGRYAVLGTDGFGLSESRPDLRNHFEVSSRHIAYAALAALADDGNVSPTELAQVAEELSIDRAKPSPATNGPGQKNTGDRSD